MKIILFIIIIFNQKSLLFTLSFFLTIFISYWYFISCFYITIIFQLNSFHFYLFGLEKKIFFPYNLLANFLKDLLFVNFEVNYSFFRQPILYYPLPKLNILFLILLFIVYIHFNSLQHWLYFSAFIFLLTFDLIFVSLRLIKK